MDYRMPAEWEGHEATWIAWPHEESDFPGKLSAINWVYTEIVRAISDGENVEILCHDRTVMDLAKDCLERQRVAKNRYRLHLVPNDRSWLRDSAPTAVFTATGEVRWVRWSFNAWAKYENYLADIAVPDAIESITGIACLDALCSKSGRHVTLEGGAIDVNGQGLLLTTEECLLSTVQERNPGFKREDYERIFLDYLGIKKTIWLGASCAGDDTHGHVDDVARFVSPNKVVLAYEEDPADENHQASVDNLRRLELATDLNGKKLEIIKLPMPRAIYYENDRLPASYANFYIGNSTVIVPTFNDENDPEVLSIIKKLFPERKVIGIHAGDLVLGFGTLHCLSQQQPK